jgi:hypothetical protein
MKRQQAIPLRTAFNDWHGYSVTILMTAMIAAVVAFFLSVRRTRNTIIFRNKC